MSIAFNNLDFTLALARWLWKLVPVMLILYINMFLLMINGV